MHSQVRSFLQEKRNIDAKIEIDITVLFIVFEFNINVMDVKYVLNDNFC